MTPGMLVLLLILGWVGIAVGASRLAYRFREKRSHKRTVFWLVIALPLWDVVPGVALYYQAVYELGGVRIHRTVEADGYLDRNPCTRCWTTLGVSPYRYIEFEVINPRRWSLTSRPGYHQYSTLDRGSSECAPFEALADVFRVRELYGFQDQCVVAVRHEEPVSRFERERGERLYRDWFPFVELSFYVIRDRTTGETIAESYRVYYRSWLHKHIGIPIVALRHTAEDGRAIALLMEDVVIPLNE